MNEGHRGRRGGGVCVGGHVPWLPFKPGAALLTRSPAELGQEGLCGDENLYEGGAGSFRSLSLALQPH